MGCSGKGFCGIGNQDFNIINPSKAYKKTGRLKEAL